MEGSAIGDGGSACRARARRTAWYHAGRCPLSERFATYREFWPHYLREHAQPKTRALHFLGTGVATTALVALVASRKLWLLPVVFAAGYGPAWVSHFFVERNRPATFTHPLWSLLSDYRMAFVWLTGRLKSELAKAGVPPR